MCVSARPAVEQLLLRRRRRRYRPHKKVRTLLSRRRRRAMPLLHRRRGRMLQRPHRHRPRLHLRRVRSSQRSTFRRALLPRRARVGALCRPAPETAAARGSRDGLSRFLLRARLRNRRAGRNLPRQRPLRIRSGRSRHRLQRRHRIRNGHSRYRPRRFRINGHRLQTRFPHQAWALQCHLNDAAPCLGS